MYQVVKYLLNGERRVIQDFATARVAYSFGLQKTVQYI